MGTEARWDEGGRRTLPGDNTGDEAVMLRPLRFQCSGVWISSGLVCVRVCVCVCVCVCVHLRILQLTIYILLSDLSKMRYVPDVLDRNCGVSRWSGCA